MSIAHTHERPDIEEIDDRPDPWEMVNGVYYPSSDGVEMGEGDWHFTALATLFGMLRPHYKGKDAYVAGDMMLYYEEGNPRAVKAPDVMVCLGVSSQPRGSWLTWVEGTVPAVVFEIASKSTRAEDLGPKKAVYERIGIPEYFAFDPIGDAFRSDLVRLRGWRLVEGHYEPIEPDAQGSLESQQLHLLLYVEENLLRLLDLETRLPLRIDEEKRALSERQRQRLREFRRSMKESLARKFRRNFRKRLEAATSKLNDRTEAERLRADALAAELEQLRARIAADPPRES
jgi:Uma2 family endonuclease